jgi:hypothetical protein
MFHKCHMTRVNYPLHKDEITGVRICFPDAAYRVERLIVALFTKVQVLAQSYIGGFNPLLLLLLLLFQPSAKKGQSRVTDNHLFLEGSTKTLRMESLRK